jgi:hypothetical protein
MQGGIAMQMVATHGTFEDALTDSSSQAKRLARALRELISAVYPDVVEVPWPKQQIIGYGVGPKKMTEHFCYIGVYDTHVNLGFNYGSDLPDPESLLEGTGKKFRHVKIQRLQDTARPALRELIKAAIKERDGTLGRRS